MYILKAPNVTVNCQNQKSEKLKRRHKDLKLLQGALLLCEGLGV